MAQMKRIFIKIAQGAPPLDLGIGAALAPPPVPGAAPPIPGAPPMGVPPVGVGGAAPVQPMSSEPERPQISGALDTLGKILYDADITETIENSPGSDMEEIAADLWQQYGGNEFGDADPNKVGMRETEPMKPEAAEEEQKATEDARWERLPKGKNIADITSLEEIGKVMNGVAMGTIKNVAKQQAAPPAGGAPPMTASIKYTIKLANVLDQCGHPHDADLLDYLMAKLA